MRCQEYQSKSCRQRQVKKYHSSDFILPSNSFNNFITKKKSTLHVIINIFVFENYKSLFYSKLFPKFSIYESFKNDTQHIYISTYVTIKKNMVLIDNFSIEKHCKLKLLQNIPF